MAKYHYLAKYVEIYYHFGNIYEYITFLKLEFVKLKFAV